MHVASLLVVDAAPSVAAAGTFPPLAPSGDAPKVLRSDLSNAQTEELISRNVAALVKLPVGRR